MINTTKLEKKKITSKIITIFKRKNYIYILFITLQTKKKSNKIDPQKTTDKINIDYHYLMIS